MTEKSQNKISRVIPLLYILLLPLLLFYYEVVFHVFTVGGFFQSSMGCFFLFSCAYGSIGYLLVTIPTRKPLIHIFTCILMGLCALPYLVEYFVYRQFKIFYDINTVVGGAGDAVEHYYREIFRLVFTFDGILIILLFLLPTILFSVFGKRLMLSAAANALRRCVAAALMLVFFLCGMVVVNVNTVYRSVFTNQYNFQSAVQDFGLYTGLGLDVKNLVFGDSADKFEMPNHIALSPLSSNIQETPLQLEEYGYNQMKLDLSGGSGRIKDLNEYVSQLSSTRQNKFTGIFEGKNLIMISAEAFTAEVIDPQLTPTLYRLATKGINFTDYYQPSSAGTTGGEYQNIFGMLPTSGGASFKETADHNNYFTMGSQLNRLGYYGKAFHNNTYTYYDRDKTHNNLGYSDGYMGYGNGMEAYVTSSWPQSDLEMIAGTLPTYIDKQPFNVYYMSVSGHSDYTRSANSMTSKNWEKVAHLSCSDRVKGYLAANLELENAMAHLVAELEEKGIADDTVICISADHFPYGLDGDGRLGDMPYLSELYGYPVNDYFQRDHSRLILWCGSLEKQPPIVVDTPTTSLDILPTLSNLFGTEFDSRLMPGRDVFSDGEAIAFNSNYDWKTEYGTYFASKGTFVPVNDSVEIPAGYVERTKTIVRNKIRYCKWALESDYFSYLFN